MSTYQTVLFRLLTVVTMAVLATACSQKIGTAAEPGQEKKERSMELENTIAAEPAALPPIDAMAPEVFETATFGLG